eukprot:TRINITY_DN816_c0_g1_i1.p1 TRINITY_DN816_c0_g1~~TRINITY_DN816_c0_g1_i1.p1  ORF type:complete len:636 (+),score=173.40 TRINITY_DN816_c0_g1_i1:39-1946(+)
MRNQVLLCFILVALTSQVAANCLGPALVRRTLDGSCNNLLHPHWGAANTFYAIGAEGREAYPWVNVPPPEPLPTFANASTLPPPGPRGSARKISEALTKRADETLVDTVHPHSNFAVFFGQFLAHDLDDNRFANASQYSVLPLVDYITDPSDVTCAPTFAPPAAPFRCNPTDPVLTTNVRYSGGVYDHAGRFSVYNNQSSYLDLGQVYGMTEKVNRELRSLVGGRMATGNSTITLSGVTYNFTDMLATWNQTGSLNFDPVLQLVNSNNVFVQGDIRANENLSLTMMHLIWTREHNLNADAVKAARPHWDPVEKDEEIFQLAREITIAKYQKIVYEEYFPNEFGSAFTSKLGAYTGYKPFTKPDVFLVFASAAFRYGHVTLNAWTPVDSCGRKSLYNTPNNASITFMGQAIAGPASFSPLGVLAAAGSYENVIRGLVTQGASPINLDVANDIRNVRLPNGVVDMITFDIVRARHNQVPNYQKIRSAYHSGASSAIYGSDGCPVDNTAEIDPLACFEVITGVGSPVAVKLQTLYKKVIHIDAFIGLFAEPAVPGSSFPETAGNIITEQYRVVRDGDRFFYKRLLDRGHFSTSVANEIRSATMASVLERVFPGYTSPANPWMVDPTYLPSLQATPCSA